DGAVAEAAIAVGACSAVARRLAGVEAALLGLPADDALAGAVLAAPIDELSPIADVRGSAEYREHAAREIVVRAVCAATSLGEGKVAA
ncbi:xanthine dehydrogenase family protein subunit M, partial [Mesorhizobium sp. M1A.F.Ca.ET.072.01.1.1]